MSTVLDFESQVLSIEQKIKELRDASKIGDIDVAAEITKMQSKVDKLLSQIYLKLIYLKNITFIFQLFIELLHTQTNF